MNKRRAKKLKNMAAIFWQAQPPNMPTKSYKKIYKELKQVHKKGIYAKANNQN